MGPIRSHTVADAASYSSLGEAQSIGEGIGMEALFDTAALARALVSAREGGYRLSSARLLCPPSRECTMTVQTRTHEARASSVAGWKVAIGPGGRPVFRYVL